MTQTLDERLTAMVRKYLLETTQIEDGAKVKAIVAEAKYMCAKELGYDSMEAARTALFPARKSFAEKLNLGRRLIDHEDDQRGI